MSFPTIFSQFYLYHFFPLLYGIGATQEYCKIHWTQTEIRIDRIRTLLFWGKLLEIKCPFSYSLCLGFYSIMFSGFFFEIDIYVEFRQKLIELYICLLLWMHWYRYLCLPTSKSVSNVMWVDMECELHFSCKMHRGFPPFFRVLNVVKWSLRLHRWSITWSGECFFFQCSTRWL